ncbi:MAG: transposase [Balneolaceae bacterium]|nr:transposase [Balneolaceae bacterium]MDR9407218.1 transposase [Balneolaceae bacterium]
MNFQPNRFYHVYNQGNNRQPIYFSKHNYLYFLKKMSTLKNYCEILAYCLMPNHFHWLIKTKGLDDLEDIESSKMNSHPQHSLVRCIANLLSSYTQAINKQENRSGSLFRSKTKSQKIDDPDYALICFLYIHQNPLRAGICEDLACWKFSSYRDYAGLRNGKLCNRELGIKNLELPSGVNEFVKMSNQTIPEEHIKQIYS